MLLTGNAFAEAALQGGAAATAAPVKRREVIVGGKRVKDVDVHAHCVIPEVWDVVKDTPSLRAPAGARADRTSWVLTAFARSISWESTCRC